MRRKWLRKVENVGNNERKKTRQVKMSFLELVVFGDEKENFDIFFLLENTLMVNMILDRGWIWLFKT